ncbi:sulfide/dihydroorotate dehydrogenase-like FAD/NAD-binding protein [Caldisericum exile]|uniref:Sulfide dehydrogenase subunit SudB n=1 Tax=Caldisericum exile (strain DSM 21853 / NBRC 104410 / AZM16c01) TaxID=511051 RepID=A0A7U6GEV2_CALEA|nr:sulfide/dihydroorotate dehydrogenase-like FAD/NAD-binding protein [Caldisericum exile]BAL81085.1 putative sulfide dehydrogenase subunit SudB [Caldisericum exile AZM16c01]
MFKILRKEILGPEMVLMELAAPNVAKTAEPGQFVVVRVYEKGERIPLTIADFDRTKGTVTIVFQKIGKTTHLLGTKNEGDALADVFGPLGNPTEIESFGKVVVVGGGIGIAPIYPISRKLKSKGNRVISIIGYRAKDYVFWEEKMRSVSDKLLISTNDGSYGEKGFVTDVLKRVLEEEKDIERVFTIGPAVMMKAVADMTRPYSIKTIASLNSLMVCGMGMCGACRVTVGGETKFTCSDGPDFDAHLVDFDELMKRLNIYKEEEKLSFEKWKEEVK